MIEVQPSSQTHGSRLTNTPPPYRITSVTEVADRAELDALLHDYYTVIVQKITAAGMVNDFTPSMLNAFFWPNLHKVLPSSGRLMLVRDRADRLVGCAKLQCIGPDAGELKCLYVRTEANGNGRGRALVTTQIEADPFFVCMQRDLA